MVTITFLEPETSKPSKSWKFSEQSTICIGRAPQNDIVLKEYFQVSRQHVELIEINDQWQLVNHGSNGTFVNSVLVEKVQLQDNDLIRLAGNGPLFHFALESDSVKQSSSEDISPSQITPDCQHIGNSYDSVFCIHCGQALVEEEVFIGNYQILRTLGKGGMGTTYLVRERNKTLNGAPLLLVLKEMNADMINVAKARELFEREARILKTLQHPNIPKYYDFFCEEQHKYLVMELVHGHDLEQLIYQKGNISLEQAIAWMIEVCGILYYLHNLQPTIIHRDIKPANLILRNLDNRLILLDFGAVKEFGTSRNTRIGVEGYSAPEQYRGEPCPQSDLYGIGTTLVFVLTGKIPMQSYNTQTNQYEIDFEGLANIPRELIEVLRKTCQTHPKDRYQSAQELAEALQTCL